MILNGAGEIKNFKVICGGLKLYGWKCQVDIQPAIISISIGDSLSYMNKTPYDSAMAQQSWPPTSVVEQKTEQGRFFQWWYSLTTPPPTTGDMNFVKREAERKALLLSKTAFLFLIVVALFFVASIFLGPTSAAINVVALLGTLTSLLLNRRGKTSLAGLVLLLSTEIPLAAYILSIGPLHSTDLQAFDLYVIINLLAVSLLPARNVFLFALGHSVWITIGLVTLPLTPAVAADLQVQTALIPTIAASAALQLLSAGVAYIWVSSATHAIKRANRAEMIAMLEHIIAEERASTEREKRELEESIQQLVQTHIAATQGQVVNRIPYPPSKALWPLVGAMNSLWARLQRTHHIESEYKRLHEAITYYMYIMQKYGSASLSQVSTGTILDQLVRVVRTASSHERQEKISQTDPF